MKEREALECGRCRKAIQGREQLAVVSYHILPVFRAYHKACYERADRIEHFRGWIFAHPLNSRTFGAWAAVAASLGLALAAAIALYAARLAEYTLQERITLLLAVLLLLIPLVLPSLYRMHALRMENSLQKERKKPESPMP